MMPAVIVEEFFSCLGDYVTAFQTVVAWSETVSLSSLLSLATIAASTELVAFLYHCNTWFQLCMGDSL